VASAEVSGRGDGVQVSSQSITIDELRRLWQAEEPVTILDVRTDRSIEGSDSQAKAAVRMPPDHVAERAMELGLKPQEWLVAYCT
jgi:rhodanese-related sulfurtransferase